MATFDFSVIASGLDPTDKDFEGRFFDAGCDDATVSFQRGHIIVDFARTTDSIEEAICSAVLAVQSVGATVDRVEPDPLVNLSEIASRSHMTRAAISQYAKGQRGKDFPAPVARVTSESPLYDWAAVANWLHENGKLSLETVVNAVAVRHANDALSAGATDFGACFREKLARHATSLVVCA